MQDIPVKISSSLIPWLIELIKLQFNVQLSLDQITEVRVTPSQFIVVVPDGHYDLAFGHKLQGTSSKL